MMNQAGQSLKFEKTPTDTISDIACSSNSQIVCCSSWDNSITLYQLIASVGNNTPTPKYLTTIKSQTKDAIICCTFADKDIIFGTATGKVCQIKEGQLNIGVVGSHPGIVSGVRYYPNQKLLISGSSYDYKLNFWDLRDSTKPANSIDLDAKCKFLDAASEKAVVVTSDNKILHYDLKQASKLKTFSSKIACPITSLAITPDGNGYIVGGLYGIIEANIKGTGADLIPCHREFSQKPETFDVYASNCCAIGIVQSKNVFISGGGNGCIEYFNTDTLANTDKKKLTQKSDPVTACCIIPQQNTYVVATGNDWSHGVDAVSGAPQVEMTIRMFNGKQIGQ